MRPETDLFFTGPQHTQPTKGKGRNINNSSLDFGFSSFFFFEYQNPFFKRNHTRESKMKNKQNDKSQGVFFKQFYEDYRPSITPKKDVLFIIGDWNAKVGSQETPGVTGKLGLGVQNEAGQRLREFCQENTLVVANTLFQ